MIKALSISLQGYRLWYDWHAWDWETQALPIGNGFLGGMFYAELQRDVMQYNEKTFWSGGPRCGREYTFGNRKDAWKAVLQIQELQLNHQWVPNDLFDQVTGYNQCHGSFQSFGEQVIQFDFVEGQELNYRRELDIEKAVHTTTFMYDNQNYERQSFASYPDRVIVTRLTTTAPGGMSLNISNVGVHGGDDESNEVSSVNGSVITLRGQLTIGHDFGGMGGNYGNNLTYESKIKVLLDEQAIMSNDETMIQVKGATNVVLILAAGTDYANVFPDYTGVDPHDKVASYVELASKYTYEQLLARHLDDYCSLFNRTSIVLDHEFDDHNKTTDQLLKDYQHEPSNDLEMLFFQYGRYMLISSSRAGTLPANLQGVWTYQHAPEWNSDYHFNVNIQMNYWAADVTNLEETVLPLIDYVESIREPGRLTAKEHFGLDGKYGWVVNTANNPMGVTAVGWDFEWGWGPAANAWICQNLYENYLFHQDIDLLRNKIYPIMRESAYFWSEFLVEYIDEYDGLRYLVASPSYSPEHGPRTLGTTYDHQLIRQHFKDTIDAINQLGLVVDYEFRNKLQSQMEMLYPTKIGQYGQIQEWMDDIDDPYDEHRHVSNLVGLYPGKEINKNTPDTFEAAKTTLTQRGDSATGWSMANKMMLWARVLDGDHAHILYRNLLQSHVNDNLFDEHPPFQIDGNLGAPAAVAEMLIQSHLDSISLLPSVPSSWATKGSFNGLKARGNFSVDCVWSSGKPLTATILSGSGRNIKLEIPTGSTVYVVDEAGQVVNFETVDNIIQFPTLKGKKYFFTFQNK